jgi:hypothetical protein
VSTRRKAAAVCPRRRERTGRRAERGSPTGHDIGRPSAVSTGAVPPRNAARGRGLAATITGSTPAAEPPKYRAPSNDRAIRRSTREIMVEAPTNWGALAIGGASRLCVLRGRERGPAGRRSTRSPRASNSPSLTEDAPANQFQSPCAGYSAGPIHFQRFRSAASGALLEGRCGERH